MAYALPLHGFDPGWSRTPSTDYEDERKMKKLFTTFAAAGLLGFAACSADVDEEPVILEEPVIEQPAPAPIVTPPPMTTDTTMMMDTTVVDTAAAR